MNAVHLSEHEIYQQSRVILSDLSALNPSDALKILNKVQWVLINESLNAEYTSGKQVYPYNPVLKRRGQIMKVDADPEMREFIMNLNTYLSIKDIVALCVEKFGKARAPSRSALHRWLQRLKRPNKQALKEE